MSLCLKDSDDHIEPNNDVPNMDQVCHETAGQQCTALTDQRIKVGREMQVVMQQDNAEFTMMSTASMPQPNRTNQIDHTTLLVPNNCVHKDGIWVDESIAECNYNKESKNMDVAIAELTDSTNMSEADTADVTECLTLSIYEREQCNDIFQDNSTPVLDMSHGESEIMESVITQNRNSALVVNSFIENVQGFAAYTVRHDTSKLETISSIGHKDNNSEAMKFDSIEKMKKQDQSKEKKMGNETEQTVDSKGGSTNFISEQGTGICKSKKQPELEQLETQLRAEKTKTYTKILQEKHTVESRDQSVVSPIIILPDTRETVIKNVAKMRAMPFTPEIKVTVPEKVKQEEPFSVPRTDVLFSEHERVSHPIVYDITLMHRDNEPSSEESMVIASGAPNRNTRDDKVEIIVEPLYVMPPQHEKNLGFFPSDQRAIEVKTENLETQMGDSEEPSGNDWSSGNDNNNIPIISIACADDFLPIQEQEKEYGQLVFQDPVNQDSAALYLQAHSSSYIPSTHVESSTENTIKQEIVPESLTIIREVVGHFDSGSIQNTNQIIEKAALQKEVTERRNLVGTQLTSDVFSALSQKTLQNTIVCNTEVCPDKEAKVEVEADRCQRDKPAMEKLGLTTPVGPTLPPLSPASLRKLMAKNNPNLEGQGSTVTLLGDGSEKKGDDSGGSTPTSTLSCESSPKMKRRDSLTLIPSATPEELASGARRKIYLAKAKSEDEGSDIQNKRDSPYMSPSQARRAAFLQLQSGQQAQQMEKRSPMLGRRKTMVDVQKSKEEPSEDINLSNTESKSAEKEKLDPYKGNKYSSFLTKTKHLKILS